ncbi:MAG: ABC transporter ATP-binding protein [Oscillospiraceae bacterium]|nr:ABC transporter ATP-binding protein [Oscillospiraceae bacterium]
MEPNTPLTRSGMLFGFLRGAKRYFILGILFACLSTLMDMARPKIIEFTVDQVLGEQSGTLPALIEGWIDALGGAAFLKAHLWIPALAVIACTLVAVVLRYFFQINTAKGGETLVKSMRDQLFDHILHLSCAWHSEHQTGDIIQRCTTDVEEVKMFLSEQLVTLLSMIITIVLSLVFMLRISVPLAMVALVSLPVFIGCSFLFHQKIGTSFQACDEEEGVLSTIAQENLTGVRVVRAFGRERSEQERFAAQNETVTDKWVVLGKYLGIFWSSNEFLTGVMMLTILCWGSVMCVRGSLTVGGLLAVISYLGMFIRPVRGMGRVLSEMSKTGVSITRLLDIMRAPVEQDAPGADQPPMDQDIVFDHVSFAYPGQEEVLHDVSFTLPAGRTLGILGGTGSGKSTLAHLLSRLYPLPPEHGTITVGGRDIQSMRADWVRRNVGFILQEPFLFSRSLADNIAITRPGLSEREVRMAARAACLEQAVDEFPRGFDTFVGERGVTLSGGQKQRSAIARTLTQNTPILIFDDSLSAVDAETDAKIRQNLKTYMSRATVILISHRITTLMAADQIIVLEDGRVTQQGTHAELAAQSGLYQTICRIQEGKEETDDAGTGTE